MVLLALPEISRSLLVVLAGVIGRLNELLVEPRPEDNPRDGTTEGSTAEKTDENSNLCGVHNMCAFQIIWYMTPSTLKSIAYSVARISP